MYPTVHKRWANDHQCSALRFRRNRPLPLYRSDRPFDDRSSGAAKGINDQSSMQPINAGRCASQLEKAFSHIGYVQCALLGSFNTSTADRMNKAIRQVWTFASDSNPDLEYQTLQYDDGTTSCNCKGWTRRTAVDGSRSCKHTRWVDLGVADRRCMATHSYKRPRSLEKQGYPLRFSIKLGRRKLAV
jgi:hypothetical protein